MTNQRFEDSTLILAPACTGKSHFAKNVKTKLGIPVVDGDDLISAAGLWPAGQWWLEPNAHEVHQGHVIHILSVMAVNPSLVVVFNGQPEMFAKATRRTPAFRGASIHVTGVVYPRHHYLQTAELRQSTSHGYKPSGQSAADQADAMLERYLRAGIGVYHSFTDVGRALGLYLKRFTELTPPQDDMAATSRHLLNLMGLD